MSRRRLGLAIPLAGLLLASCADGGEGLVDRLAGSGRVQGGSDRVVVHGLASAADALPFAIAHCSHYKKSAQFERREGGDYMYRCTAR